MEAENMTTEDKPWFLRSKHPVDLPRCEALTLPQDQFEAYLTKLDQNTLQLLFQEGHKAAPDGQAADPHDPDDDDTFTLVSEQPSTTADIRQQLEQVEMGGEMGMDTSSAEDTAESSEVEELADAEHPSPELTENRMLTENGDIAYRSTNESLLDLFTELEEVVSGPRLLELLNAAWIKDPLSTVELIFNARSIHIGKASRHTFYRCAGWLARHHPLTLVSNLRWLSRPVIEKKVVKKTEGDEDIVIVEPENDDDTSRFDVRFGVSHGYWKDLLNVLALSVNGNLEPMANPRDILNVENEDDAQDTWFRQKQDKTQLALSRHANALSYFTINTTHHALHLAIARLFAEQLKIDLATLRGNDEKKKREISLCAKWAPSLARFHDKHTFVATSIAEIMFPVSNFPPLVIGDSRELYLRHAREEYRRALSALRAHLGVVERDITAGAFSEIKYETVPSLAMKAYSGLFAEKDGERFTQYLSRVRSGKATISGAVLMPSLLVHEAMRAPSQFSTMVAARGRGMTRRRGAGRGSRGGSRPAKIAKTAAEVEVQGQVLDGQWETLVQRVRDSGTLDSCIAVCDVSGSMNNPKFPDGTCPMDSSIGLSLLMAEVVAPPFGGAFITFSSQPCIQRIDTNAGFRDRVRTMRDSEWNMDTNFVAVFEDLILPMAMENKLRQEQMVKRVFVFSDMQFNSAQSRPYGQPDPHDCSASWESSYERIKNKYAEAGYEMPELVFWNLAGGRAGVMGHGDPIAPKPVTAEQPGVAMVGGYSQGMLKVFMDNGMFEEDPEEVETEEAEDDVVGVVKKKARLNPVDLMMKAIGHKAYGMLKVVD